jgi:hypothetical protein
VLAAGVVCDGGGDQCEWRDVHGVGGPEETKRRMRRNALTERQTSVETHRQYEADENGPGGDSVKSGARVGDGARWRVTI